jgi:hypothetical protein
MHVARAVGPEEVLLQLEDPEVERRQRLAPGTTHPPGKRDDRNAGARILAERVTAVAVDGRDESLHLCAEVPLDEREESVLGDLVQR